MNDKEIAKFARRIRASVKRTGAPGLEEELRAFAESAANGVEMRTMIKIADTLGVTSDACIGREHARETVVRVEPFVASQLRRVRDALPFLGANHHEMADYIFKRFIWDELGKVQAKVGG